MAQFQPLGRYLRQISKPDLTTHNERLPIVCILHNLDLCKPLMRKALTTSPLRRIIRELKQPRRRRQQKPHEFAYLTMKNRIFARFARALFIFWHFEDVLVLSTTWNDLFCSCEDDVSIWWQLFNFVFLSLKHWFQFNSWIVRTHFATVMTLNNSEMIAETRSYIFRWRSRCRRRCVCVNSCTIVNSLLRFLWSRFPVLWERNFRRRFQC